MTFDDMKDGNAGRATVEFVFSRGDGTFVDKARGGGKTSGKILVAVDGYSAPITAGNFVHSIVSGAYDGADIAVAGETISISSPKLERKSLSHGEYHVATVLLSHTALQWNSQLHSNDLCIWSQIADYIHGMLR